MKLIHHVVQGGGEGGVVARAATPANNSDRKISCKEVLLIRIGVWLGSRLSAQLNVFLSELTQLLKSIVDK